MKTIKDVFAQFKNGLSSIYEANEIEALTLLVLNEITTLSKGQLKAFTEKEISEQQAESLEDILNQLKTGKPVQYILGETEFYGLPFYVNPSVLIPRPETEELVEWILESVGLEQLPVGSILDIGTGSGCIAISLKKNLSAFKISAIDISAEAIKTAKENALLNNVEIEFIEADILNLKNHSLLTTHYSLLTSNPPYVTLYDKTQMHTNVTNFEPHTALFVPENDPLIFYKSIANFAIAHLAPNGMLFFEINEAYGKEVVEMLEAKSFQDIELRKDMGGRDRMVKALLI